MTHFKLTVPDAAAMEAFGAFLSGLLKPGSCVYLIGDLGAGKTTLVRGLARGLGYTGRVNSPTFTLMNCYPSTPPINHLDFYRLDTTDMIDDLGLDDYMNRDAITLIEWPEIGEEVLQKPTLKIAIHLTDDDYDLPRLAEIEVMDPENKELSERLENYVNSCH